MSRTLRIAAAGVLLALCIVALAGFVGSRQSLREWLRETYEETEDDVLAGAGERTETFTSADTPRATADAIAEEWKPADRRDDPSGVYLRYRDDVVAVTDAPGDDEGSIITVDDDRHGYRRWYGYVGGWWGIYTGRGDSFRGGGPGAGK